MSKKYEEHNEKRSTNDNIMRMLAPSIIGIIVCMLCLAELTWAWFSDVNETPKTTLTAAEFKVAVEVKAVKANEGGSEELVSPTSDGEWELTTGNYTVTLTATGANGYSIINLKDNGEENEDRNYRVLLVRKDDSVETTDATGAAEDEIVATVELTLTITPKDKDDANASATMSIKSSWGKPNPDDESGISSISDVTGDYNITFMVTNPSSAPNGDPGFDDPGIEEPTATPKPTDAPTDRPAEQPTETPKPTATPEPTDTPTPEPNNESNANTGDVIEDMNDNAENENE